MSPVSTTSIPLPWVRSALDCGPSAIRVAVSLWDGVRKLSSPVFRITVPHIAYLSGISVRSVQRGLKALEAGGLVAVERNPGEELVVTVIGDHKEVAR